jgi:hypothetical protein
MCDTMGSDTISTVLGENAMFEPRRKSVATREQSTALPPEPDAALRDEVDDDPLIEQMVARLRDGMRTLDAIDEWGRPVSWRNVVRIAVGPLASALRDAQTAAALGSAISREATSPAEPDGVGWPVGRHSVEPAAPAADLTPETVELEVATSSEAAERPEAPIKISYRLGDHGSISVGSLGAGELLRGGSPDDSTSAKYDRFLTSLYGERKQVGGDQDGGARGPGLGDDLQGGVNP